MNLSQLEYLDVAARQGSFTDAARELCVTQQAVSLGISALERELGVRVLERSATGVRLSYAGQELLPEARAVLMAVSRLKSRASSLRSQGPSTISFAYATCTVGTDDLRHPNREDILVFTKMGPDISLRLFEAASDACLALVSQKTADIALVAGRPDPVLFTSKFLCKPELALCVSSNHPFATRDRQLSYADLKGIPQFLPPDLNYSFQATNNACLAKGFEPLYTEASHPNESQIDSIAAGRGVAFMPENFECALADHRVRLIHMREDEACRIPLWLTWLKAAELTPDLETFIDYLVELFANGGNQSKTFSLLDHR